MRSSAVDLSAGSPAAQKSRVAACLSSIWAAAILLMVLAILVRLIDLSQLARFDELYTLLAARGWLSDGVPRIAEGTYSRAQLYTMFVAWWLKLFGDSLVVARLPSVLFGSLLAVAVFLWTNAVAGRAAAWISGLFVAFASISIEMSQFARFYTLHALTFWLGATGVYTLTSGQGAAGSRQLVLGVGTALSLFCALYLQILTMIGIVALALWLGIVVILPAIERRYQSSGRYWTVLGAVLLVTVFAAAMVLTSDFGQKLLLKYLETPLTVIQHRGAFWFYHLLLIERYPTLWPIFPFLALIAVAACPKPSIFAICIFGVAFTLVSFAGQKSLRYVYFALPFLFVVWAIALVRVWGVLRDAVLEATNRVVGHIGPGWRGPLRAGLIVASIAFLLLSNGSSARTLLRPLGVHLGEGFSANWPVAVPQLEPWVQEADVVLTSHELHMLYYLGRADIVVGKARLAEFAEADFARDPRTGLPVVSKPESLELILACYPTGVLVTETIKGWREPVVIDDRAANLIVSRMTPIDLPARSQLRAFRWEGSTSRPSPTACANIPIHHRPAAQD